MRFPRMTMSPHQAEVPALGQTIDPQIESLVAKIWNPRREVRFDGLTAFLDELVARRTMPGQIAEAMRMTQSVGGGPEERRP